MTALVIGQARFTETSRIRTAEALKITGFAEITDYDDEDRMSTSELDRMQFG